MLADSVVDWIEYEGWQELSFDDVAIKVKTELERFPENILKMIGEMEIIFVQNRIEGLEEVKRNRTVPIPFNRIKLPEYA
jgi:hypothetical protein